MSSNLSENQSSPYPDNVAIPNSTPPILANNLFQNSQTGDNKQSENKIFRCEFELSNNGKYSFDSSNKDIIIFENHIIPRTTIILLNLYPNNGIEVHHCEIDNIADLKQAEICIDYLVNNGRIELSKKDMSNNNFDNFINFINSEEKKNFLLKNTGLYISRSTGIICFSDDNGKILHWEYVKFTKANENKLTFYGNKLEELKLTQFRDTLQSYNILNYQIEGYALNTIKYNYEESKNELYPKIISNEIISERFILTTNTGSKFVNDRNIDFLKESEAYILWYISSPTFSNDINHFTCKMTIENQKCTECCDQLEWYRCGENSDICYHCPRSIHHKKCFLSEEDQYHKCKSDNKTIGNFAIKEYIDCTDKLCKLCHIDISKIKFESHSRPPTSHCKKINGIIVDTKFWIIKIILASLNTMISLSIINLENLPYDFTGLVTDTYEILYPINDKSLLTYNLTFLLGYMILFEIPFLLREMCTIDVLIDNHKDRFINLIVSWYIRRENYKSNDNKIMETEIISFKKRVCDIYFILGCIYFAIASFTTFIIQFTIATYDEHPIIFTIIQLFKLQFMFTMISRFMNLNLYRICSADKYKSEDISNNYPHEKYYKNDITQHGDTKKWWLFN